MLSTAISFQCDCIFNSFFSEIAAKIKAATKITNNTTHFLITVLYDTPIFDRAKIANNATAPPWVCINGCLLCIIGFGIHGHLVKKLIHKPESPAFSLDSAFFTDYTCNTSIST
ncbi:hypothetical protein DN53_16470 [Flagellimonas olearia]|uniref:Uncharacterized protein n=1 Tax=Flagellimonas olearia TaxID=552546 RepID=A0A444VIW5_9FLAO|nr:hypothetical protein DN53_16470 [Allomuricauda olearia]